MEKNIQEIHAENYEGIIGSKGSVEIKFPTDQEFEYIGEWSEAIRRVIGFLYENGFRNEEDRDKFLEYLEKKSVTLKKYDNNTSKDYCYGIKKGKFEKEYNLTLLDDEGNLTSSSIIIETSYKIAESDWYIGIQHGSAKPRTRVVYDILNQYEQYNKDNETKSVYDIKHFKFKYKKGNNKGGNNMGNKENNNPIRETIKDLIKNGRIYQIILTGAPGTGKTYMAKEIAEEISKELGSQLSSNDDKNYKLVQFHPSYDYTDFVEGIRPIANKNNEMIFKKIDGVFKAFCRNVATLNKANENNKNEANENKKKLYFFIIDEINRADLSKVLGELMLGLEKDKREEPIETQYSNIKTYYDTNKNEDINEEDGVFKNGFFIPENIVIIGTMNDIDRSVESMDFALRRRFTWIEVEVDEKSLIQAFEDKSKFCEHIEDENDRKTIINQIVALNKVIKEDGAEYNLNKHYFISQGYFTNIPNIEETKDVKGLLKWVWKYRIKSLIEEYVRAENSETINTFIEKCEKAFLIDGE